MELSSRGFYLHFRTVEPEGNKKMTELFIFVQLIESVRMAVRISIISKQFDY